MPDRSAARAPRQTRRSLPSILRPLFWEHDFGKLRWDRDRVLVMTRLLVEGGWAHVRLLRSRLGDAAIRDWILRRKGRGLSPERLRFWELILKLPPRQVDAWVRSARRHTWGGRRGR